MNNSNSADCIGKNKTVICYVRPWNEVQLKTFCRFVFPSSELLYISEHKNIDQLGLSRRYYSYLNIINKKARILDNLLSDESIFDFIGRCRLLRILSKEKAEKHLLAMSYAVSDILKEVQPSYIVSLTVDSFVMDLIRYFSNEYNIKFIGMIPTFVNGYYRVTQRGEPTINKTSDKEAVKTIKNELLKDTYTPAFVNKAFSNQKIIVLKRWIDSILRIPFFGLKRVLYNDFYNYHYWVLQRQSLLFSPLLPPIEPGDKSWESKIRQSTKPKIYIPLQMFPECTIDYWCTDIKTIEYYRVLNTFINNHYENFDLLVKEHPGVIGGYYRPKGFYRKLKSEKKITVVPTFSRSNKVLEMSDAVLVWTGTAGFEAALRGKAVFTLGDPYYASGQRFHNITTSTKSDELKAHIEKCNNVAVTDDEQDELIRNLVNQLFKGSYLTDGTWSESNANDIENTRIMAKSLRNHLDQLESSAST